MRLAGLGPGRAEEALHRPGARPRVWKAARSLLQGCRDPDGGELGDQVVATSDATLRRWDLNVGTAGEPLKWLRAGGWSPM